MIIKGIQETTLLDYPGKIACTLFLCGCNFRCGFCHNPELVLTCGGKKISKEEILAFLKKRKNQLDGICITGGEPLIHIDREFLEEIKDLGYLIKIDTNGSYPEILKELIDDGLVDYVAMDIKAHKDKYNEIAGTDVEIEKIEESMRIISELDDYEFRTTILENIHDYDHVNEMVEWILNVVQKHPKKFALQGFRNQGKFIDPIYEARKDTTQSHLEDLKDLIEDRFEEVVIRI